MIPRGDRSGAVIEPYLTDQWYVRIAPLASAAVAAVETGRVRFVPGNWDKTYFQWMRNIQDWCISRQLWWGHRIPAWYDEQGHIYVARDAAAAQAAARVRHGREVALRQDEDVLDTWFSSALWPFSTLGWPAQTRELRRFYPTDVLVTGFDIIFFWVARMLMFGLKFMDQVPFREVYVHGLILDAEGQKMSKSKGNVIDPLDVIDGIGIEALVAKRTGGLLQPHMAARIERATRQQYPEGIHAYGTDALRFTFASLATQSRDIRFDLARVAGSRNFCNKLWNAARFALGAPDSDQDRPQEYPLDAAAAAHEPAADRWIRSRLGVTIAAVDSALAGYRFDFAATALYEFTWNEFCAWYLEIVKPVLQSGPGPARTAARRTLLTVLETLLRALHPLMPFITEEIWLRVAPLAGVGGETIMRAPWPRAEDFPADPEAETELRWIMQVVLGIRQIHGEMDIAMSRRVPVLLQHADARDLARAQRHFGTLARLGGIASLRALESGEAAPPAATALVGELALLVPMAGLIEPHSELARLSKRLQKVEQELARASAKLANDNFINHAPAEIVTQERLRLAEFERTRTRVCHQLAQVRALLGTGRGP
jgi:valyl-tRNA synthetase